MKKILTIIVTVSFLQPCLAQVSFNGTSHEVIDIQPETSTGLNDIYVMFSTAGTSITYTSKNTGTRPEWSKFSNLGGGYAEQINDIVYEGEMSTLIDVTGDMGYIIRDGSSTTYFWIVDYSSHALTLDGVSVSDETDCQTVALSVTGKGNAIRYYTINGQGKELDRNITLKYDTLEYDEGTGSYVTNETVTEYAHLSTTLYADAPLCNTEFILSGDRFLSFWGMEEEASTPTYEAIAVTATTSAEQNKEEIDNEISSGSGVGLGGSAPLDISFGSSVSDAVVFTEWQMSKDSEFNDIEYRETNVDFTYTFRDAGTTYVRFAASNSAGTCDYFSPTYEVTIGESEIKCPNAFSPGSSEGVNDIWKVSYKSIVSFECHIFNRWGVKVASFTNPSEGWDGKYNGKLVPAGVYYYVINAKGADGKSYKLKGDINIINFKRSNSSSSSSSN